MASRIVLFLTFRFEPWYRASLCNLASLLAAPGEVTPFRSTLSSPAVTDVATADAGIADAGTGVVFGAVPGAGAGTAAEVVGVAAVDGTGGTEG